MKFRDFKKYVNYLLWDFEIMTDNILQLLPKNSNLFSFMCRDISGINYKNFKKNEVLLHPPTPLHKKVLAQKIGEGEFYRKAQAKKYYNRNYSGGGRKTRRMIKSRKK